MAAARSPDRTFAPGGLALRRRTIVCVFEVTSVNKPSALSHQYAGPAFYVGQNRLGEWVVQDRDGRLGGIFRHRAEALRFVFSDQRAAAVFMVPDALELSFGMTPSSGHRVNGSAKCLA